MKVRLRAMRAAGPAPVALFLLLPLIAPAAAAAAPKFVGPNRCISCHDHDKQKAWYSKDTHAKALEQLEDKKAAKYTAAIGLADPYDKKGSCVSCHATVFNGDANAGVSCETCHGAGSDYLEPHQQKGSYAKALTLGMFDTRGNLVVWAKMCVGCHVVTDRKLVAAGHSSGAGFDVGAGSRKIVHWDPAYDFAKLTAEGKTASAKRGGGAAPAAAPAAPAATPAPKPTAAPAKPTAAPAPAESTKPAATKAAPPAPAAPPTAPRAAAPMPSARPTSAPAPRATPPPAPATAIPIRPTAGSPAGTPPLPMATPVPSDARGGPGVQIVIESTPIPRTTPFPAAPAPPAPGEPAPPPGSVPPGQPPPAPASAPTKRPAAKKRPPKPRARARAAAPAAGTAAAEPVPTLTPTRRPAPQEPPRRAPH